MRSRELASAGTILDADWADVYSIAAQVTKLGRYATWREEEQTKGITLSPDYFVTARSDDAARRAAGMARDPASTPGLAGEPSNAGQSATGRHPSPAYCRRCGGRGNPARAARPSRHDRWRLRTRAVDRPGRRRRAADHPPRPGDRDLARRPFRGAHRRLQGRITPQRAGSWTPTMPRLTSIRTGYSGGLMRPGRARCGSSSTRRATCCPHCGQASSSEPTEAYSGLITKLRKFVAHYARPDAQSRQGYLDTIARRIC